jgi:hypothetical protein
MSRQFPGGKSLMLFGDRCDNVLEATADSPLPLAYGPGFGLLCVAANAAGAVIVER